MGPTYLFLLLLYLSEETDSKNNIKTYFKMLTAYIFFCDVYGFWFYICL